jgi:gamma-glutamylcyclotransferase (GGCT)/AIG2-like uncharacterized protein YtfP
MKELVFVYGTLKENFCNEHVMKMSGAEFLTEAETTEKFPMFDLGDGFPYLQNKMGTGEIIQGEIWEVPSENMYRLDHFEGVPHLYKPVHIDYYEKGTRRLYASIRTYCKAEHLTNEQLQNVKFLKEWEEQ